MGVKLARCFWRRLYDGACNGALVLFCHRETPLGAIMGHYQWSSPARGRRISARKSRFNYRLRCKSYPAIIFVEHSQKRRCYIVGGVLITHFDIFLIDSIDGINENGPPAHCASRYDTFFWLIGFYLTPTISIQLLTIFPADPTHGSHQMCHTPTNRPSRSDTHHDLYQSTHPQGRLRDLEQTHHT